MIIGSFAAFHHPTLFRQVFALRGIILVTTNIHHSVYDWVDAVGEGAVSAGPDLPDLVIPGPLIHKYIVMDSSHFK